ncbi:hypothetical protein OOZ15_01310 [Galbibacter sp. EGI 63066]|uniref:hypothetical protein n=1 Tax=Galbibacter sp. EGI 63066 TaxID=2993559 RepID=UPI0022491CD6|nr:hypothetical protein [Galbibacter sp. EGI 63066]MCX2678569.1 hypothetical protein [Galbibacter sp. EGI 63066]
MKKLTLLFLFLSFSYNLTANCDSAYSQLSYALAHTKKSLDADNFDHQKYYADRAVAALEKTKGLVESCGCNEAVNPIIDGLDNLNQATDPADWEAGRFYMKKAHEDLQKVMTKLDMCSTSGSTASIDYSSVASSPSSVTDEAPSTEVEQNLMSEQQKLEAEKQRLLEQQRLLEEKIAKQQQLAEQARINRQHELDQQLRVKHAAEQSLFDMEKSLKELASTLDCNEASEILNGGYSRGDEVLNDESLKNTRDYYLKLTVSTQQKVLNALNKCMQK